MRTVIQRVSKASVSVDGQRVSQIDQGLLVLLGVEKNDTGADAKLLASKTIGLRIFDDDQDKMNLCLTDVGGQLLVVSQFTLLGDARKGRRPCFVAAAEPQQGNRLYELFVSSAGTTASTYSQARSAHKCRWNWLTKGPLRSCWIPGNSFDLPDNDRLAVSQRIDQPVASGEGDVQWLLVEVLHQTRIAHHQDD